MILLSITGLFRTLLIIAGAFLLLRLIGRVLIAKRNMEEHQRVQRAQKKAANIREESRRNFGKVTISKIGKSKSDDNFTDYEEIKED